MAFFRIRGGFLQELEDCEQDREQNIHLLEVAAHFIHDDPL